MLLLTDPLWVPRPEPTFWEQVNAVMGWYHWSALGLIVLASLLCLAAWRGLRGTDALSRRPTPLPDSPRKRRSVRGRHAMVPPSSRRGERVAWLGGEQTEGWWIWQPDEKQ